MDQDFPKAARARTLPWAILLFVFVAGVYAPSWNNGFVYDDMTLIVDRPALASASDYARLWTRPLWRQLPYYRPVSESVMAVEKLAFGLNPGPFHLVNALLCAAAALAFFRLLVLPAVGAPLPAALLAAALFGVHPVAADATYPATVLETLLATLFALAAARAWIQGGLGGTFRALAYFSLSMLSKESGVVVAGVFAAADLCGLSRVPRSRARSLARHGAAWALLAGYLALRHGIVGGHAMALALPDRPLGPFWSLAYTLQTHFAPFWDLVYEPWLSVWPSAWRLALAGAGTAGLAAWAWRRRGDRGKTLFFAGWFLLFVLPTANVLEQEALFAERYNFTALAGLLGVVAVLAGPAFARPRARVAAVTLALALVAAAAGITAHRARFYADEQAFLEQWLATNPGNYGARSYLGTWHLRNGRPAEAADHLEKALDLTPPGESRGIGIARSNLGVALEELDREPEALAQHRLAASLSPEFPKVRLNFALALEKAGRLAEAEAEYRAALDLDPRMAEAHRDLGLLYGKAGRYREAADELSRAVALDPGRAESWLYLGHALANLGQYREAAAAYSRALALDPGNARARESMDKALQLLYKFSG